MKQKLKTAWNWLKGNIKDPRTFFIFFLVAIVLYSSVYIPFGLAFVFTDYKETLISVATSMAVLWASPMLPFFPITIAITLGIKGFINKREHKKDE